MPDRTRAGYIAIADDVVRKPVSPRLLVEQVKAVLRRAAPKDSKLAKQADSRVLERGPLRVDLERHTCTWKNQRATLSATEFRLLHARASRPGVVKSRNALLDVAYDDPTLVDKRNIDSRRLRKKLTASGLEFDMVEALYGVAYRFKEE